MRTFWQYLSLREFRKALSETLPVVALAFIVCATLLLGINLISAGTDDTALREKVSLAFADGTLTTESRLLNNKEIGAKQDNDCLVLSMALNSYGTLWQRAMSPFGRPSIDRNEPSASETPEMTICGRLNDIVVNGNEEAYDHVPYHRYIHGYRAFAELVIPWTGVQNYRNLLLTTNYLLLLAAATTALLRAAYVDRRPEDRSVDLGLCMLSVLLISVSGVQYFDMSLAHGAADLAVHAMLLSFVWFGVLSSSRRTYFLIVTIAACFTIYFEFLTGQIPFAIAILVALPYFCMKNDNEITEAQVRSVLGTAVFCVVSVLFLGGKFWISSIVFGPDVWTDVSQQLEMRTSIGDFSLLEVFARLAYRTHHIAFGSTILGILYILGAFIIFFLCLRSDVASTLDFAKVRAYGIFAGALSILVWYLLFTSHSAIHSWFMIRPIALFAALAFSYKVLRLGPLGSLSSHRDQINKRE